MPTPENIALIYDFERVMETSLKSVFTQNNVKAFTSQMIVRTGDAAQDGAAVQAGYDLIDFQKDRPRAEIMFIPGAGQGRFVAKFIGGTEMPVETSWKGQFKIDLITPPDIRIHAAFRTKVRFIMHTQLLSVNGTTLRFHKIQNFYRDGGTSPVMKPEEGVFQTSLIFDLDFSLEDCAWDLLEN